jgi:hypothetical protein
VGVQFQQRHQDVFKVVTLNLVLSFSLIIIDQKPQNIMKTTGTKLHKNIIGLHFSYPRDCFIASEIAKDFLSPPSMTAS